MVLKTHEFGLDHQKRWFHNISFPTALVQVGKQTPKTPNTLEYQGF